MKRLSEGLVACIWAVFGCLAAILAPILFLEERTHENVSLYTFVGFMVAAILYIIGWLMRYSSYMRVRREWIGLIVGNSLASVVTTITVHYHRHHESRDAVIAYILVAVAMFALIEISRPVFDFGILQFYLRLPVQTAIAYAFQQLVGRHAATETETATTLIIVTVFILIIGTVLQAYSFQRFIKSVARRGIETRTRDETCTEGEYLKYDSGEDEEYLKSDPGSNEEYLNSGHGSDR